MRHVARAGHRAFDHRAVLGASRLFALLRPRVVPTRGLRALTRLRAARQRAITRWPAVRSPRKTCGYGLILSSRGAILRASAGAWHGTFSTVIQLTWSATIRRLHRLDSRTTLPQARWSGPPRTAPLLISHRRAGRRFERRCSHDPRLALGLYSTIARGRGDRAALDGVRSADGDRTPRLRPPAASCAAGAPCRRGRGARAR